MADLASLLPSRRRRPKGDAQIWAEAGTSGTAGGHLRRTGGWEELAERWDDGQEAAKKLAGRRRIHVGGVSWSADTGGGRGGMLLTFLPIDIQVIATCYSVDMQVLK